MMRRAADRFATWFLRQYPLQRWGLRLVISPYIVQNLGPMPAIRWALINGPRADRLRRELGSMGANFVLAVASLLNGCSYCLYAHARAFELYYFDKHGKLFPLDQHELLSLIPLTDEASRTRLENALQEAGLEDETATFRRLYALKLEAAKPENDRDRIFLEAIEMYDMLNFCANADQLELDDAHDEINKNQELKARYAEARLKAGRKPVRPEDIAAIDAQVAAAQTEQSGFGSRGTE